MCFSDMGDYLKIDDLGNVYGVPFDLLGNKTKAIKKIKQKKKRLMIQGEDSADWETEDFEFELYNKLDALQTVMPIMGMEKPRQIEVTGKDGGPINVHNQTKVEDLTDGELFDIIMAGRASRERALEKKKVSKKPA